MGQMIEPMSDRYGLFDISARLHSFLVSLCWAQLREYVATAALVCTGVVYSLVDLSLNPCGSAHFIHRADSVGFELSSSSSSSGRRFELCVEREGPGCDHSSTRSGSHNKQLGRKPLAL